MSWNDLSMKDKASYIRMGVENGITDLDTIREVYNKFAEGGNLNVNDSPEKRIYDHDKGVYYVEGQDAPNNLKYSLDEFTQEQINEINSKYNKGWKTDRKGNVIFNKYTGTPLNTNLRKSFANNNMKQALTNTYSALTPISKLIKVSNPKYYWLKPAISFTGNLMEPLSKIFKEGGPIKKSYKDFSTRLSKAWNNHDLSKDDYDYQKYYNDGPEEAYRQLESIEHGGKGHFPDGGKSGTYKTPNHPTYPDLGSNSWLNNDRIFNMSARQAVPENTDRVLDYLGSDLDYNRGATKVMYDEAYQLPEVTVTPNGNYTELIPNELGTGWMYRDRDGRFDDVDYSYLDNYLGNKKAFGGNLYGNGGSKPRYKSSSNIRKQISTWEGSTMRTNVPFDRMDTMFNQVLPEGALEKLSQEQLDGLYSFAYNVGTGRFKTRTAPTLAKYLQGNATIEDVKNTIWASGDKKYRGLANRRKKERSMLGDYVPVQETISMTTPLDITPAAQPIIESNPVIQDNIETFPLAFNIESQKESDYTPGFLNYVNYINQIRQPKQRDRRIWLTI